MNLVDPVVKVFCNDLISWPGFADLLKPAVCLGYAFAMANGDPAQEALAGAKSLCDAFTVVSSDGRNAFCSL